jgi:predicted transcriptional regulator of viral defense system
MELENTAGFRGLGAKEMEVVAQLSSEQQKIISSKKIEQCLPLGYKYARQLIYRLKKKGILRPIKKGFYTFSSIGTMPVGTKANEFVTPNIFLQGRDFYIGYSTLFNRYNFSEQLFQTVYVINTSRSDTKIIDGITYKFVKVPQIYIYGVEELHLMDGTARISDRERTMIDLIYRNEAVGGILPAMKIAEKTIKEKDCSLDKFIEYASRFPNITVRKRIGVLLERLKISDEKLKDLIKSVQKTALSSLFPGSRKGTINKKWQVIENGITSK